MGALAIGTTTCPLQRSLTENTDGTTSSHEHTERADILLGQGVLDSRGKEANTTSEGSGLRCCCNSILGVVAVTLFVVRHGDLEGGAASGTGRG